jgi:hypothetical protein
MRNSSPLEGVPRRDTLHNSDARRVGCALRTLYLSPAALVRTGFFRGTPVPPIFHNFSRQREAAKFFVREQEEPHREAEGDECGSSAPERLT